MSVYALLVYGYSTLRCYPFRLLRKLEKYYWQNNTNTTERRFHRVGFCLEIIPLFFSYVALTNVHIKESEFLKTPSQELRPLKVLRAYTCSEHFHLGLRNKSLLTRFWALIWTGKFVKVQCGKKILQGQKSDFFVPTISLWVRS